MLLQLFKRTLHGTWIDAGLQLFVGLFHAVQISLQAEPLACTVDAGDSAELRAVNGDPLATNEAAALRNTHQIDPRRCYRLAMDPPELGDRFMVRVEPAQQPH